MEKLMAKAQKYLSDQNNQFTRFSVKRPRREKLY